MNCHLSLLNSFDHRWKEIIWYLQNSEINIVWKLIPEYVNPVICTRLTKNFFDPCFWFFLNWRHPDQIIHSYQIPRWNTKSINECFGLNYGYKLSFSKLCFQTKHNFFYCKRVKVKTFFIVVWIFLYFSFFFSFFNVFNACCYVRRFCYFLLPCILYIKMFFCAMILKEQWI